MTPRTTQPDPLFLTPSELAEAILVALANRQPLMIHGPVGIGKSSIVRQAFALAQATHQTEMTAYMDPTDANGIPVPNLTTGEVIWCKPALVAAANAAAQAIGSTRPHGIFWDEFNRGPMAVQNTVMRGVLDNVLGIHPLAPNVCHIAAVNDAADSSGIVGMSAASKNRFTHVYIRPTLTDVVAWGEGTPLAAAHTLPCVASGQPLVFAPRYKDVATGNLRPEVLSHLRKHPDHLHAFDAQADAFATPRSWEAVSNLIGTPSTPAVEAALIAGNVGTAIGRSFCNTLAMYRAMVGTFDLDDIIQNPRTAPLPGVNGTPDISAFYAVGYGLASRATPANFGRVLTYADRLPNEWNAMTVFAAVRRDPDLKATPGWTAWSTAHIDMI